jgi:hypothetical protein
MSDRLYSVTTGSNARVVADILRVLFPDARTVLDTTYGKGRFWSPKHPVDVAVTGLDLDPARARDRVADFRNLADFADESHDVGVFDPPYQWDMSKRKPSRMGARFGTYRSEGEARTSIQSGAREVWRTSRLGIIVKVQDHVHSQRVAWLSDWVKDVIPVEPFDQVHLARRQKMRDPKWRRQLSVWRNHATFWIFRKDGQIHRARRRAS